MRLIISLSVALALAILVAAWGLFSLGQAKGRIADLEGEARLAAASHAELVEQYRQAAEIDGRTIDELTTSCGRNADSGFDAGLRLGKSFCALP